MRRKSIIQNIGTLLLGGMLLLGACTKEDVMDNPTPPSPPAPEGEGYLSFRIDTGDPVTTKGETAGTAEENQVNSVRVILYDPGVDTVKYAFHFNIETNPTPSGNDYYTGIGVWVNGVLRPESAVHIDNRTERYKFITYGQKVDYQDYNMLVIVNPTFRPEPDAIPARSVSTRNDEETVYDMEMWDEEGYENHEDWQLNLHYTTRRGQHISKVELLHMPPKRVTVRGSIAFVGDENEASNFVMTNFQELIPVKKEMLQLSRDLAHENPVPVSVDRVVAKVIVREAAAGLKVSPSEARIGRIDYYLDYANQYSYWWRRMTWLKDQYDYGQKETQDDHSDRALHYAQDPNFDGFYSDPDWQSGLTTEDYRRENFFNSTDNDFELWKVTRSLEKTGPGTINYVLENTLTPEYQKVGQDYYTRVVVKANYVPPGIEEYDSYYVFNNRIISWGKFWEYYDQVAEISYRENYVDDPWSDYSTPNVLKPFPKSHDDEPEGMSGLFYAIFMLYTEGFEGDEYPGGRWIFNSDSFGPQRAYGLSFFMDGINYYTVPIRHFDFSDDDEWMGYNRGLDTYGYYGVVRNNIYTITINSISGPGHPTPGGSAFISAGINIMPWHRVGQEIEIGEIKPITTYVTYEYYRGAETEPFKPPYLEYDVVVGQPIEMHSEILDRYYGSTDVPASQYGHGIIKSKPSNTTVQGDPAFNVVKIVYPALQAAPQVTFNYLAQDGRTVLKAPITRAYAAEASLTIDNIRSDGLIYNTISYLGDTYSYAGYDGTTLPATLQAGSTYQVNLLYTKPGGGMEKSAIPWIWAPKEGEISVIIFGINGATIKVFLPDGTTQSGTVSEGSIQFMYPTGFVRDQLIKATQTEPGKLESDEADAIVGYNT